MPDERTRRFACIALMEGIMKSMMTAKVILVSSAVLIVGLMTSEAGVLGYPATRPANPAPAVAPQQQARQPAAAAPVAQDPPRRVVTKPAADPGPLVIPVEVVDPEGRRLSGVDLVATIWYSRGSGERESVVERTRSDGQGNVRLAVARERPGAKVYYADVWAYQPGRAIAMTRVRLMAGTYPPVVHLTLNEPEKWTITVRGPGDRPIAGLRLAPGSLRMMVGLATLSVPDELLQPLTLTTDARGVAPLSYLPQNMAPVSIQVSGPGVAPHTLPLDVPVGKEIVLKLGRSGRVVGIVRTASGQPLADIPVEVWVQGSGTLPTGLGFPRGNRRITGDAMVQLDQEPLKTGPQGAFQTPPTLLSGSAYRVSIRHDGFVPFVSDWVTLNGERATLPPIRLQPLQKLTGQLEDRQGRAVAGAASFCRPAAPRRRPMPTGDLCWPASNPGRPSCWPKRLSSDFRAGWSIHRHRPRWDR